MDNRLQISLFTGLLCICSYLWPALFRSVCGFAGCVAYLPSGLFPSQRHSKSQSLCSTTVYFLLLKTLVYMNFPLLFLVSDKCEKMLVLFARVTEEFLMRKAVKEGDLCFPQGSTNFSCEATGSSEHRRTGSPVCPGCGNRDGRGET